MKDENEIDHALEKELSKKWYKELTDNFRQTKANGNWVAED